MKTNQEILDDYGRLLIKEVFDKQYQFIQHDVKDLSETKGYENLFQNISDVQKKEIEFYTRQMLKNALFNFLRIFEENDEYKLYYERHGQRVNLAEASEMLKAEPIIDNGWIDRFTKTLDSNDKIHFPNL